jgi:hypothetical protein
LSAYGTTEEVAEKLGEGEKAGPQALKRVRFSEY